MEELKKDLLVEWAMGLTDKVCFGQGLYQADIQVEVFVLEEKEEVFLRFIFVPAGWGFLLEFQLREELDPEDPRPLPTRPFLWRVGDPEEGLVRALRRRYRKIANFKARPQARQIFEEKVVLALAHGESEVLLCRGSGGGGGGSAEYMVSPVNQAILIEAGYKKEFRGSTGQQGSYVGATYLCHPRVRRETS